MTVKHQVFHFNNTVYTITRIDGVVTGMSRKIKGAFCNRRFVKPQSREWHLVLLEARHSA